MAISGENLVLTMQGSDQEFWRTVRMREYFVFEVQSCDLVSVILASTPGIHRRSLYFRVQLGDAASLEKVDGIAMVSLDAKDIPGSTHVLCVCMTCHRKISRRSPLIKIEPLCAPRSELL